MQNFARSWRPKNFEEVIGQELAVSLLKNSLYRCRFFPVYLFSGQRGCGKTTLARIFSAALNCSQLALFQEQPHQHPVPCGSCRSCLSMLEGVHPDFHEIDAASHTGVDHVRSIIETTLLLPQLGSKKIYLIDEAHMLSKAAFNALLKTLEEPVATTLFLLVTTDIQKIIDTVKSRCFQIFLKPIAAQPMFDYLSRKCAQEALPHDQILLEDVISGAEGSLRDALNRLERQLLARDSLDGQNSSAMSEQWSTGDGFALIEVLLDGKSPDALKLVRSDRAERAAVTDVWRTLMDQLRMLLLAHHGVALSELVSSESERVSNIVRRTSAAQIIRIMERLFAAEQLLVKTTHPQIFLEMIVAQLTATAASSSEPIPPTPASSKQTQLSRQNQKNDLSGDSSARRSQTPREGSFDRMGEVGPPQQHVQQQKAEATTPVMTTTIESEAAVTVKQEPANSKDSTDAAWESFVARAQDPLHRTLLQQSTKKMVVNGQGVAITLLVPPSLQLFCDLIDGMKATWEQELRVLYGAKVVLHYEKIAGEAARPSAPRSAASSMVAQSGGSTVRTQVDHRSSSSTALGGQSEAFNQKQKNNRTVAKEEKPAVVDEVTKKILELFPGVVTQIKDNPS